MSYQDALRAHNRRVANPRMAYHTPTYYRVRSIARGITKLVINTFWGSLIIGFPIAVWFLAALLGEALVEATK